MSDHDDANPFARGALAVVTAFAVGGACVVAAAIVLLVVEACSGR